MENIYIPSNYEKIAESYNESLYNISYNDKFIKMICDTYNIKLYLVIQRRYAINVNYICIYHHNNYVSLKNDSTNHRISMYSNFMDKYDSFQMNVDECIVALKEKMINALMRGFNKLMEYNNYESFGILPCGSSEREIIMKMKLMGFE